MHQSFSIDGRVSNVGRCTLMWADVHILHHLVSEMGDI